MEIIKINGSQKIRLCNYLAKSVFNLKKDDAVQCIYFAPYENLGDIKGRTIKITIVVKDRLELEKQTIYGSESKKISAYEQDRKDYGFKIYTCVDRSSSYTAFPLNPSRIIRRNHLLNSTILFDRTGEYTRIKKAVDKQFHGDNGLYYYTNLVQIEPPILDDVTQLIEEKYCGEKITTDKQFVRSKGFK